MQSSVALHVCCGVEGTVTGLLKGLQGGHPGFYLSTDWMRGTKALL